jgi:glyoxylase-like metal-dependent hydrolase (beta-lactamase superfamily II)
MDAQQPDLAQTLSPRVRRVLADNPSHFTYTGTQTYIVGKGDVAVIDPGPAEPDHIAGILRATEGERIIAIVCTHTHKDHSPGAKPLAEATGAEIVGCAPLVIADDGPRADASFDTSYAPTRILVDGDRLTGPDWTLEAVATPGHTSNHLCFALVEEDALFTGDHVMGWSTTVVSPPDGDMAAYMASLAKLQDRSDAVYYPAHGEPVTNPQQFVRGLGGHRKQRERQILKLVEEGVGVITDMVPRMYKGVDERLYPAAGRSVLAHLIDLRTRGEVIEREGAWQIAA